MTHTVNFTNGFSRPLVMVGGNAPDDLAAANQVRNQLHRASLDMSSGRLNRHSG